MTRVFFHNKSKKELELVAFSGIPTEHLKIPFGKGICGQSALSNNPILVSDVTKESNYISCNINVKSEIVVPLFDNEINILPWLFSYNYYNGWTPGTMLYKGGTPGYTSTTSFQPMWDFNNNQPVLKVLHRKNFENNNFFIIFCIDFIVA